MPKYFAYVRKSTESKERQILSLPGQIRRIQDSFPDLDITFLPAESKSAFKPYVRPIFEDMIARIKAGEADGIVAWHPNRLSRNEIDAATISYMLRTGELANLKFTAYNFENSIEGLMALQGLMSHSQYESGKLQQICKQGMADKAELGHFPAQAPPGYLNSGPAVNKGERFVYADKKRLPLVERALRLALTGDYTVAEIRRTINSWGFTGRKGRPLSYNQVSDMLRSIFYTGYFKWNGRIYHNKGTYPAVITLDEHRRLLDIMARHSQGKYRRYTKRSYVNYTGLLRCLTCGGAVVVTEKWKHYSGTNRDALYLYYHCTHKKRSTECHEPAVTNAGLVSSFEEEVEKYRLIPEFRDVALEILEDRYVGKVGEVEAVKASQRRELERMRGRIQRLIDMRADGEITSEEFMARKDEYQTSMESLQKRMETGDIAVRGQVLKAAMGLFEDLTQLDDTFRRATPAVKRRMLLTLGSNLLLHDRKVVLQAKKWYHKIREGYSPEEAIYLQARTSEKGSTEQRPGSLALMIPNWWTTVNVVADLIEAEISSGGSIPRLIEDDHPDFGNVT
ncbi:recombinase family protein [Streptomyces sp. NBC_00461]|uniref:recombinase family protein n=1 Tax=Streptomyces sp. NBC_00461 TaxID=2975750 RepID=UPI002E1954C5